MSFMFDGAFVAQYDDVDSNKKLVERVAYRHPVCLISLFLDVSCASAYPRACVGHSKSVQTNFRSSFARYVVVFSFFFFCLSIQFHQASSFLGQSRMSRKPSEISSKDHLGNTCPIQYLVLYLSPVAGVCGSVRAHAPAVFCEEGYTGLLVVTEDSPIGKAL